MSTLTFNDENITGGESFPLNGAALKEMLIGTNIDRINIVGDSIMHAWNSNRTHDQAHSIRSIRKMADGKYSIYLGRITDPEDLHEGGFEEIEDAEIFWFKNQGAKDKFEHLLAEERLREVRGGRRRRRKTRTRRSRRSNRRKSNRRR
jgi:hypothetical protein